MSDWDLAALQASESRFRSRGGQLDVRRAYVRALATLQHSKLLSISSSSGTSMRRDLASTLTPSLMKASLKDLTDSNKAFPGPLSNTEANMSSNVSHEEKICRASESSFPICASTESRA